jgi:hypothetical protein
MRTLAKSVERSEFLPFETILHGQYPVKKGKEFNNQILISSVSSLMVFLRDNKVFS